MTPTTKRFVSWSLCNFSSECLYFRFAVIPGLTGSLTQYTNAAKLVDSPALGNRLVSSNYVTLFLMNDLLRTVVWAKAIVTITHLLALPGRNTTHSACVAIVDFIIFSTSMCLFFMLRTAITSKKYE